MKKSILCLICLLVITLSGCNTNKENSADIESTAVYESLETATPSPEPTEAPTATPEPVKEGTELTEADREGGKMFLGLTDEELDNLTQEELYKMLYDYSATLGGTSSGGSSNGNSSSGSSSNSGSTDASGLEGNDDDLPTMQLNPDDGSLPGSMSGSDDGIGLDEFGNPIDPSEIPQLGHSGVQGSM